MTLRRKINHFLLRAGRRLQLKRVWAYPEILQLVPTNACNLRCAYCPKTHYPTDNRHMSPEVYERVQAELFPRVRQVNLQGLGEPLLAPLFPRMLEDAFRHGFKIQFVTNATLLRDEMIPVIVRSGADVAISLDGARAETHEKSRPGSRFSQILDVFEKFQNEKRAQPNSDFHLSISTVVNRLNVGELDGLVDLAARYGIALIMLINPGVGDRTDPYALDAIGKHPELFSRIRELEQKARAKGVHLNYPEFLSAPPDENASEEQNAPADKSAAASAAAGAGPGAALPGGDPSPTFPDGRLFPGRCLDPWNLTYIDVDGWVRLCCRALWVGMGNIMQEPFRKIWNNEHYRRLRGSINTNNPPEFCRSCNTNWGINRGDETRVEKLKKAGVTLPPPPRVGVT